MELDCYLFFLEKTVMNIAEIFLLNYRSTRWFLLDEVVGMLPLLIHVLLVLDTRGTAGILSTAVALAVIG